MRRARCNVLVLLAVLVLFAVEDASAGIGGTRGSNGVEPWIEVTGSASVGQTVTFTIRGNAPGTTSGVLIIGIKNARIDISQYFGSGALLTVQPSGSVSEFLVIPIALQNGLSIQIPPALEGIIFYLQGIVVDAGATGGLALTDGTSFTPATGVSKTLGQIPRPNRPLYAGDVALDPATGITYVFGGVTAPYPSRSSYIYDLDQIVEVNPANPRGFEARIARDRLPYRLSGETVVWHERTQKIYIIGGGGEASGDLIIEYDPRRPEGSRVRLLEDRLPIPRSIASAIVANSGEIFIFGGLYGSRLYDIVLFDPEAPPGQRIRTLTTSIPQNLFNLWPVGQDDRTGKMYLTANYGQVLVEFTPPNGPFVQYATNIPFPPHNYRNIENYYPVLHKQSGKILVIGGGIVDLRPPYPFLWDDKIYALDPATLNPGNPSATFELLARLPRARHSLMATVDPLTGLVYVTGGWGGQITGEPFVPEITVLDPGQRVTYDIQSLPEPRSASAAAQNLRTGTSYIISGQSSAGPVQTILRFTTTDAPSTPLPVLLPQPLSYTTTAYDRQQDAIIIFGGDDPTFGIVDTIYALRDTPQSSSITLEPERLPTPLSGLATATDPRNGKIYLAGGPQILEWNPSLQRGSRLRSVAQISGGELSNAGAAWNVHENALYIFGGLPNSGRIMRFTPDTGRVDVLQPQIPDGRFLPGVFYDSTRRRFFILGGTTQSGVSTDAVLEYDPTSGQFRESGQLATPRGAFSSVYDSSRNAAYIFGGSSMGGGLLYNSVLIFSPDTPQTPAPNRVLRSFFGTPSRGDIDLGFNVPANEHTLSYGSLILPSPARLVGAGSDRFLFTPDDRRVTMVSRTNVVTAIDTHLTKISGSADLYLSAFFQQPYLNSNVDLKGHAAGSDGILGTADDPPSFNYYLVFNAFQNLRDNMFEAASSPSRSVIAQVDYINPSLEFFDLGQNRLLDPEDYRISLPLQPEGGFLFFIYLEVAVDDVAGNCFITLRGANAYKLLQLPGCRDSGNNPQAIISDLGNSGMYFDTDLSSLSENGQYFVSIFFDIYNKPTGFSVYELGANRVIDSTDRRFMYTAQPGNEVRAVAVEDEGSSANVVFFEVLANVQRTQLSRLNTGPDRMFGTQDDPPISRVEVTADIDEAWLMYYKDAAVWTAYGRLHAYHYA